MSEKNETTITVLLQQLDELTAWFESEDFVLEKALDKFAEAEKLAAEIDVKLADFKHTITQLKQDFSK